MAGSRSPNSSRNTEPSSGHISSQPLRSATAPVKAPRRWPNSSDSTSVGDSAEILMGKNDRSIVGERQPLVVERDVARLRDGARHQLLSGAGRAGDQRRELAHARVQRAPVAPHIVREDGLPDGRPQPRRRHGTADDVAEDLLEGPLDLAEAGEGVARVVAGRQAHSLDLEEVAPVGQKAVVESPARRRRLPGVAPNPASKKPGSIADRAGAARRLRTARRSCSRASAPSPRRTRNCSTSGSSFATIRHTLSRGRSGSSTCWLQTGSPS